MFFGQPSPCRLDHCYQLKTQRELRIEKLRVEFGLIRPKETPKKQLYLDNCLSNSGLAITRYLLVDFAVATGLLILIACMVRERCLSFLRFHWPMSFEVMQVSVLC